MRLVVPQVTMRYPKLQAAIDDMLSKLVQEYGEDTIVALIARNRVPEPVETAIPVTKADDLVEDGDNGT